MKRFIFLIAGLALTLSFISIDADARRKPQKAWKSEEQKLAEDPNRTTVRAWGRYEDFAEMNLEALASANARAQLASQTAVLVSRAIELYAESKDIKGIDKRGNEDDVRAMQSKATNQVKEVTKEIIQNSRVMKTTRYDVSKKNSLEICYAVVEISLHDILINIKQTKEMKAAMDDLERSISGNEAAQANISSEEFEKAMEKAFIELKDGKLNAADL